MHFHLSLNQALLKTIALFTKAIAIYIFISSYGFLPTMLWDPSQHYFMLVCQSSSLLSKCFMTAWIKNHQRPIWDARGYLESRPLIMENESVARSPSACLKWHCRRLTYCFLCPPTLSPSFIYFRLTNRYEQGVDSKKKYRLSDWIMQMRAER